MKTIYYRLLSMAVLHAVFAFSFALLLTASSTAAEQDSAPGTMDDIATRHQDAALAVKRFAFASEVKTDGGGKNFFHITSSGTVNTGGWSQYSTIVSTGAGDKSMVTYEYYVKDDIAFRLTTINDPKFPGKADVSEGWEHVDAETFHRDVPLNPLYFFAQFIGSNSTVSGDNDAAPVEGCEWYGSKWGDGSINMCIAGDGLVSTMSAEMKSGVPTKLTINTTPQPEDEPEITPPDKVATLFSDIEKKNAEDSKK